jgi:hypothetical protein
MAYQFHSCPVCGGALLSSPAGEPLFPYHCTRCDTSSAVLKMMLDRTPATVERSRGTVFSQTPGVVDPMGWTLVPPKRGDAVKFDEVPFVRDERDLRLARFLEAWGGAWSVDVDRRPPTPVDPTCCAPAGCYGDNLRRRMDCCGF